MRKYLFNGGVIGAVFGLLSPVQATRKGPRDWRLAVIWGSWALTLAVAVITVRDQSRITAEKQRARRN
ncbi:MAG TPA: hypothetical protein VN133_13995 [Humibacter sp.]|jgi:hypothetical protein|nr:hypothetical protein [Humibacter sp.]